MLQAEAKPQYDAWFGSWWDRVLSSEERELMEFLKDQRNSSVKTGEPAVSIAMESIPFVGLQRELEVGGGLIQMSGGIPGEPQPPQPPPQATRSLLMFYGPINTDVVSACGRHLQLLRRLVEDFERDNS